MNDSHVKIRSTLTLIITTVNSRVILFFPLNRILIRHVVVPN